MRLLVLNWLDRQNPEAGGAELHLHETFGRLVRRGHEVTLVTSGWPGAPRQASLDGLEIHRTGTRYTYGLTAPGVSRRLLADRSFDVVVEDLNKVPVFAPLWSEVPVVLLVHHLFGRTAFAEASFPVAAATWLLERPVPRVFSRTPVIAVSQSTRDDLVRRGFSGTGIEVIPNGVDLEFYSVDASEPRLEEPTLLCLGRLKKYKQTDLVLLALQRLRESGRSVRLLIAGSGDHEPELRKRASALGLDSCVEFLGFVTEVEKRRLYRGAWAHVFTSPKEGWGLTNVEAAACGTPSVASDSPGLRESVRHEETGLLVPHGNVDALTRALGCILADAELRERLGRGARRFAEGFSWDETARRTEDVLEVASERR
jgi:glycosyltransferase involved in cell wall biosynthesis